MEPAEKFIRWIGVLMSFGCNSLFRNKLRNNKKNTDLHIVNTPTMQIRYAG